MKLLLMLACSVLLGCGVIFGLVHGLVPHLVTPDLLPAAQSREPRSRPVESTILSAGVAVRDGAVAHEEAFAAR